jgi:ankyrin repeat protein
MKARIVGQEADSPTIIDHSPSSLDRPIPTIVVQQGSKYGHSPSANAPDNLPVASTDTHRAPVFAKTNRAEIEWYNAELLAAAHKGDAEEVGSLLRAGADVDAKDQEGMTPLSCTAMYGHKDIVESLLRAGAEVDARDKEGKTPLDWARMRGLTDVVELLQKWDRDHVGNRSS